LIAQGRQVVAPIQAFRSNPARQRRVAPERTPALTKRGVHVLFRSFGR
jgi:hypothetical protein